MWWFAELPESSRNLSAIGAADFAFVSPEDVTVLRNGAPAPSHRLHADL